MQAYSSAARLPPSWRLTAYVACATRRHQKLLIILGASGAGKSSFLRAGLIARLGRDRANFFPLPVIRPEKAVLTGAAGLIQAAESAFAALSMPLNRADIAKAVRGGAAELLPILAQLAEKAAPPHDPGTPPRAPPSLVLSIDQAEELFLAEGGAEAKTFMALLRELALAPAPNLVTLFTIRSDAYERLQTATALEGIRQDTFALPPMPRGAFQTIIDGPAQRLQGTRRALTLEPALTAEPS